MKKILLIISIIFPIFCFSQGKNIVGIRVAYEFSSNGFAPNGGGYFPQKHGFSISSGYERMLKNNWSVAGDLDYSLLLYQSANYGFNFFKSYYNIYGISVKTLKYFGNTDKFYSFCGLGLKYSFALLEKKEYIYATDSYLKEKTFKFYELPLFVEIGCGYWFNNNCSVFANARINYDTFNFYNMPETWRNYSINTYLGIKYRF